MLPPPEMPVERNRDAIFITVVGMHPMDEISGKDQHLARLGLDDDLLGSDRRFDNPAARQGPVRRQEFDRAALPFIGLRYADVIDAGPKAADMVVRGLIACLLYTSPSPRDLSTSRMPSSA